MAIRAQGLLLALAVSLGGKASASAEGTVPWRTDFAVAARECQAAGRLLLIQVGASWCAPCRQMHQTAWRDSRLVQAVQAQTIPVSIDADKHGRLLEAWGVTSLPTTLFVTPSGQIVQKIEGKAGATECLQALQRAQQRFAQMPAQENAVGPTMELARRPAPPPEKNLADASVKPVSIERPRDDQPTSPASAPTPAPAPVAPRAVPLAVEGHCPVTMIEKAEMVPGKPTESAIHAGKRYLFASANSKLMFLEAPHKYAPGEAGRCVVTYAEQGRWIDGDVAWPALFGDRVFFLASESLRQKFLSDPERYVDDQGRARRMQAARPARGERR